MISNFIVPLLENKKDHTFIGTAFCINNFLITAGHVISEYRMYYAKSGNKFFEIYPDYWIIRQHADPDHPEKDIAICRLDGLKSPLILSTEMPIHDTEAEIICWQKEGSSIKQTITNSLIYRQIDQPSLYKAITLNRITHGASGCPILQDNKIIGMLVIGTDKCILNYEAYINLGATHEQIKQFQSNGENTCLFIPSKAIQDLLNELQLSQNLR